MGADRTAAVLLFDDVEVLDFAAPFEVLSVAGRRGPRELFDVFTVSPTGEAVRARNGLRVQPTYGFADCPAVDVLVVPGGYGSRTQMRERTTLAWVRAMERDAELVLGVCTGSLILAAAGLLRDAIAATHCGAREELAQLEPTCHIVKNRVAASGKLVTTAGVSAGLDGSLYVVERLAGPAEAAECAAYIEYAWEPQESE